MRYVVSIYDCFDGGLRSKLITANDWRDAIYQMDEDKSSFLPKNGTIQTLQDIAADQDWFFTVTEV